MRTHLCGEVNEQLEGQNVRLCGWVDRRRDLGGLIFIGLRDHAGVVQVVVEPDNPAFQDADALRNEFCARISGTVRLRPESQWNEAIATGKVEIVADEVELLNASDPMPLLMTDEDGEEIRLKYRYLDLRRPRMQHNLRTRARMYINGSTRAFERAKSDSLGLPELRQYPGDGRTICRTNCQCHLSYAEREDHWEVTWVLGEAEHCPDCVTLSEQWAPLVVPKQ
jgi:hypothetical protein